MSREKKGPQELRERDRWDWAIREEPADWLRRLGRSKSVRAGVGALTNRGGE